MNSEVLRMLPNTSAPTKQSPRRRPYISCIKIDGVPIIPPLITPERRLELQYYRQKAIEVERRLKCERELRDVVHGNNNNTSRTLEHLLSFGCEEPVPDASNISFGKRDSELPFTICDNVVPSQNKQEPVKPSRLSCNIFDVTEYSSDGVIIFHSDTNTAPPSNLSSSANSSGDDQSKLNTRRKLHKSLPCVKMRSQSLSSCSSPPEKRPQSEMNSQSKPRLLRSNSYTLESPSPVLLEHFKKQAELETGTYYEFETYLKGQRTSPDLNGTEVIEEQTFLPLDTDKIKDISIKTKKNNETIESCKDPMMVDKYTIDILNLLDEYKNENDFSNQNDNKSDHLLFDTFFDDNSPPKTTSANDGDVNLSSYSSQTLYLSSNGLNATSTPLLIDFETEIADNDSVLCIERNLNVIEDHLSFQLPRISSGYSENERNLINDDNNTDKLERKLKERWAAVILTAAAKGYLVRRLKRTERVKNLIQTIRDALVCAVNLHADDTDAIQPSDVELHRRLIQQVSAACYEFYDVFFALTTKEQMAMIALDRQRLQEKLMKKKKTSAGSKLNSSSGKSTPKSQKQSFDVTSRQRQQQNRPQRKNSLTPSFAA